jgi:hypothetical protein
VGLVISTVLQPIFLDVLLVIAAPLARKLDAKIGQLGTPRMPTAMAVALECGIVFTVLGVASFALAGLLNVPFGKILLFGLLLVIATIIISIAIMTFLFHRGFWDEERMKTIPSSLKKPVKAKKMTKFVPAAGATVAGPTRNSSKDGAELEPGTAAVVKRGTKQFSAAGPLRPAPCFPAADRSHRHLPRDAFRCRPVPHRVSHHQLLQEERADPDPHLRRWMPCGNGGRCRPRRRPGGLFSASSVAPLLVFWAIAAVLHIAVASVAVSGITTAGPLARGRSGARPGPRAPGPHCGLRFPVHGPRHQQHLVAPAAPWAKVSGGAQIGDCGSLGGVRRSDPPDPAHESAVLI